MGQIATGVFKRVVARKQSALKTIATAAGGGQSLRRVTSTLDLKRNQYRSNEINASQQRKDSRLGVKSVEGSISGEMSPGTYQMFFESVMRQLVQNAVTSGALTTIAAATAGAGTGSGTFTRGAGSFLTDGFRAGDLVRASGFATTAVANNAKNMIITDLTALVMTVMTVDGTDIVAKAAGDSVTLATPGKATWIPLTGHTRDYYTIEHLFADTAPVISERFVDCVIGQASIKLPATGMATVDFSVMGLDMQTGTAAYFTAPVAASSSGLQAAVNGALLIDGVKVGTLTSLDININGNYSAPGGVVGSNVDPDIFPGTVDVTGTVTALLDSTLLRDKFLAETEGQIVAVLTTSNAAAADATVIVMNSVKFGAADKDDGEKGISVTLPFMATEYTGGNAKFRPTTISIQDTLFV